jgi:acyl CoA:acetate/3-ketoacid CoA transferase
LASRPHVTAGVGGFIDITAAARAIVFCGYFTAGGLDLRLDNSRLQILKEGKNRKFVPEVEHVTFSGRRAKEIGQKVIYVTERCVLRLGNNGLEVFEIAPGIDLQRDVLEQTNTPLRVAKDLKIMEERLFRPEPLGLKFASEF